MTGVQAVTLQTWVNRKLITEAAGNPGAGQRRLYSPVAVIAIRLMIELSAYNVAPSAAQRFIDWIIGNLIRRGRHWFSRNYLVKLRPAAGEEIVVSGVTLEGLAVEEDRRDPSKVTLLDILRPHHGIERGLLGQMERRALYARKSIQIILVGEIIQDTLDLLARLAAGDDLSQDPAREEFERQWEAFDRELGVQAERLSRFTEEQILEILKQDIGGRGPDDWFGAPGPETAELCKEHGIEEGDLIEWRYKYHLALKKAYELGKLGKNGEQAE